eukprot:394908-Rhodomonas_salina.1
MHVRGCERVVSGPDAGALLRAGQQSERGEWCRDTRMRRSSHTSTFRCSRFRPPPETTCNQLRFLYKVRTDRVTMHLSVQALSEGEAGRGGFPAPGGWGQELSLPLLR